MGAPLFLGGGDTGKHCKKKKKSFFLYGTEDEITVITVIIFRIPYFVSAKSIFS